MNALGVYLQVDYLDGAYIWTRRLIEKIRYIEIGRYLYHLMQY